MPPDTPSNAAPSYSTEKLAHIAAFTAIDLAAFAYLYVRRFGLLFSRPILWPVILLFLPKINLISFSNETSGIRLDDAVLLLVAIWLFGGWLKKLDFIIEPLPAVGFLVVGVFCLSNLINAGHSSLFYSLRLIEYLVFFWSGRALVRSGFDFPFVVKLLIGINCAFIFLQSIGIVGGFTAYGYESPLGRPFGLSANHPAEMGALFNVLFAALAFEDRTIAKFWFWFSLVGFCIFITGSRSSLFAHCLLTCVYVYRHSRNKINFMLRTGVIVGLLITVFAVIPNPASERSTDLFSWKNTETFKNLYDNLPVDNKFTGLEESGGEPEDAPEGVDISWYMRGYKWAQVVKVMLNQSWTGWIFGLGPGAVGIALDGGWLRLIAETGVVGTLSFLALLRKISLVSASCAMAVLGLATNMLMLDTQMAYKVMAFVFLLVGAQEFDKSRIVKLPQHSRTG